MVKVALKRDIILTHLAKKCKSQNSLAYHLGITSGHMSQLLTGKRCLSPEMRNRFLKYFEHLEFDNLFEIVK
jgi:plasmid maintenance system antidote protein VapI